LTRRPGIITGLASESACLDRGAEGGPLAYRLSGADSARALAGARELIAEGCDGLVSFGMAGGLDPALTPGTLVVADEVIASEGRRFACHATWAEALRDASQPAVMGALAAATTAVCSPAEKGALRAETGALAVDMESGAVALAAAEAGLPFVALRVVADPADAAVPAWIMTALDERGEPRMGAFLAALARHPLDLFRLVALAFHSRKALARLGGVAASLSRSLR
jgi:adenosylhomocysteine nucleosidase